MKESMARLPVLLMLIVVTLIRADEDLLKREIDIKTSTSTVTSVSTVTSTTVLTTSLFCASFFPETPTINCRRKRQYLPYEPAGFFRHRYPFENVYHQFEEDAGELVPSPVSKMEASDLPDDVILFRDLKQPFYRPANKLVQPSFERYLSSDNNQHRHHQYIPYHHQNKQEEGFYLLNGISRLSSSWYSLFSYLRYNNLPTLTHYETLIYSTQYETVTSTVTSTTLSTSTSYTDTSTFFIVGSCIPAGVSVCSS